MKPPRGFTRIEFVVVLLVLIVLLACGGFFLPLITIAYLFFGWIGYVFDTLPIVTIDWPNLVWGMFVLLLFGIGLHHFCRWFYASWNASANEDGLLQRVWPKRWTAAIVGIVIAMFVSGIAMVGVAHQIAWLATSEQRLLDSGRTPAKRALSMSNLKNIAIGATSYHSEANHLPPAVTYSPEGLPLYGWPVSLLPHLDSAAIYRAIDREVPWHHPRNKKPLSIQLPFFLSRGFTRSAETTGEGYAAIHYAANWHLLSPGSQIRLQDIPDGAANTLLFGEIAAEFQPWGSTNHLRDPSLGLNRSPTGFGSPWKGMTHFAFADGRVMTLSDDIDPDVLRALTTPDGGEKVGDY